MVSNNRFLANILNIYNILIMGYNWFRPLEGQALQLVRTPESSQDILNLGRG
jgi:hypothetical protein